MSNKKIFSLLGIVLILIIGFIHTLDAPDSFEDAIYKGWLFYANGFGALIAAFGISRGKPILGWRLGFFIAAGSLISYILSRTIGLPFIPPEPGEWLEHLGVASLIAEALFIALFIGLQSRKKI